MNSVVLATPAAPRRTTPIRLGITAALLAVVAPAQTWLQLQPAVQPLPRRSHSMVFDAARNVTLLFGGENAFSHRFDETWSWNGTDWALLQPSVAPRLRVGAGMVYDSARQLVVLFGGFGDGYEHGYAADTWEWNGTAWLERTPVHAPAPRVYVAMAYDTAHGCTVLFGGVGYLSSLFADTWLWDGADWVQLAPAHSPGGRFDGSMVHDSARGRCVLFGGKDDSSQLADTWLWDGTDWGQQLTVHAPSPRRGAPLVYDSRNQRVVLFGGYDADAYASHWSSETWEYDGNDWTLQPLAASPGPRAFTAMAYDEMDASVVMFGGVGDLQSVSAETWRYRHGTVTATFATFGQGCLGSVGMPQLALAAGLPIVGTKLEVRCTNLQLDHFTTMWLGFSNTNWFLGNLPYDLGALGMPGCTLFVSNDIVVPLLNWNGTAFWTMQVPNLPQFVGLSFYLQAGVIDHVNPLGMVVTNAAEVRFGDQ